MDENKNSILTNIMVITIAIVIGGVIVHYLLKSQTITPVTSPSSLQTFNTSLIESRLDSIEQRLQQLQLQQPIVNQPSIPAANNIANTLYKNNEIRKYIRDAKGRITSTEIIRNAKIS